MADVMTYVDRYGYYVPREERKTFPAKLVFKRAELLYDASQITFVKSDILPEENQPMRHYVAGIADDGNINRTTRLLNLAHSECVELLYPYSRTDVTEGMEALDDVLTTPEEYVIDLALPEGFSRTTLNILENLIHEYMLCRVLSEWLALTYPEASAEWEEKRVNFRAKIQDVLSSRTGKTRRKCKPF